jgi:cell division protein FtsW
MSKSSIALIISVGLVFSFGLLMIFNIASAEFLDKSLNVNAYFVLVKQFIYFLVGIFLGFLVYYMGYKEIIRLSPFFLFISILLLALVFVPKVGITINGARRWIGWDGFSFQPSEIAKYLIPIYCINYFLKKKPKDFFSFLKFLSIFIIPIGLILMEPDNGTTAIILVTLSTLFFLSRIKLAFFALPLSVIIAVGSVVAYNMPHVPSRIKVYLNPELDIKGKGHQPYQAKIATGSGKLFGKGLGESMQKLNYLPQAKSDYIAAIFAEETGFFGILALIGVYLFISYIGFHIAANASDKEGFYLASIMTFLISFQAFLNLGIVSGLLPSKGTTLPFFSQGGTSLIVNIIAIFLILNVASENRKVFIKHG